MPSQAMTRNSQSGFTSRTSTSGYAIRDTKVKVNKKELTDHNLHRLNWKRKA
jgi:hypothetical protein